MNSPQLTMALAQARMDDLYRAADAHRATRDRAHHARSLVTERSVTLRFASTSDKKSLARLAALDSAEPPEQPVLLAEVDGQLVATLSLSDGTVVADPFHPTLDVIELLQARARQLDVDVRIRRSRRSRLRSLPRVAAWSKA